MKSSIVLKFKERMTIEKEKKLKRNVSLISNEEIDWEVWMTINTESILNELFNDSSSLSLLSSSSSSSLLYSNQNVQLNVHFNTLTTNNESNITSKIDENPTTLYRREAIQRWLLKRNRRIFHKRTISKARKDYAQTRERSGGRFVKSKSPGWVGITAVNGGLL
mmetsp:Transcript_15485/g.16236  ORF Transcript_15485/g.16236 Transcript_15485/m.16236 type:complete len:164 (+) Transcript_15485:112-603(+)